MIIALQAKSVIDIHYDWRPSFLFAKQKEWENGSKNPEKNKKNMKYKNEQKFSKIDLH